MTRNGAGGAGFAVVLLAGAALAGLLASRLSPAGTLAVAGLGLALVLAIVLRKGSRTLTPRAPREGTVAAAPTAGTEHDTFELRLAHVLFYVGTLTISVDTARPVFALTVSEIAFLGALGLCVVAALRGRAIATLPASIVAGASVFAAGGVLSSLTAEDPMGSALEVLHFLYVVVFWGWTAAMVLRSRRQVLVAITLWALSTGVDGLAAATQSLGIDSFAGSLEGDRATGLTGHPNNLGGAAAIALVPALAIVSARTQWHPAIRPLRWIVLVLIAAGLVLSGSVAGMAAALVATAIWLAIAAVRASVQVAVVAGAAAMLLIVAVAPGKISSPTQRLERVTSAGTAQPGEGSGRERITIVRAAWSRIREQPFVGTGLDTSGKAVTIVSFGYSAPYQVHGAPLASWYSAGILGLIGFVITFGAFARVGWTSLRLAVDNDDLLIGAGLLSALAAFFVWSLSAPFVFQQYAWISVALLIAWRLRRDALVLSTVDEPGPGLVARRVKHTGAPGHVPSPS